jgi:hypothetical protein
VTGLRAAGAVAGGLIAFGVAFAVGFAQTHGQSRGSPTVQVATPSETTVRSGDTSVTTAASTTIPPCDLSAAGASAASIPVEKVCSSAGAPHFDTPQAAMVYLAAAWNSGSVQRVDYVTDPAGRRQMDAMAAAMVNLQFKSCSQNPAGDYTCFFSHDITQSTSPTTYPNPGGYPPGEAVFTVAPAAGPGWYLTYVIHCG